MTSFFLPQLLSGLCLYLLQGCDTRSILEAFFLVVDTLIIIIKNTWVQKINYLEYILLVQSIGAKNMSIIQFFDKSTKIGTKYR